MPLIAYRDKRKKTQLNETVLENIFEQMQEYCSWVGITDMGFFIEESAKFVFANDQLWKKYLEDKKQQS